MSSVDNLTIDEARIVLSHRIGNGQEYRGYCKKRLAGDFAVGVVKEMRIGEQRAEKAEAKVKIHAEAVKALSEIRDELEARVKELEDAIKLHRGYYVSDGVYPNYGSAELDLWKKVIHDT